MTKILLDALLDKSNKAAYAYNSAKTAADGYAQAAEIAYIKADDALYAYEAADKEYKESEAKATLTAIAEAAAEKTGPICEADLHARIEDERANRIEDERADEPTLADEYKRMEQILRGRPKRATAKGVA